MKIEFFPISPDRNQQLTYVIVLSRYQNQWILVRHTERSTWEIPAGHIEIGEHPDQTARRELWEETGACDFRLQALFDYTVNRNNERKSGRVYFAEIEKLEQLPAYEIAEINFFHQLPEALTYPEIQPAIFHKADQILSPNQSNK